MAVAPGSDDARGGDGGRDGILAAADVPGGGLADRGIGFQAAGFGVTLLVSTTILRVFDGSDFWLYQWFETAMTVTYWSAVAPLAAFFDWGRKMFERGKAIREAKKLEIWERGRREGRREERHESQKEVQEARQEVQQEVQREAIERFQALLKSRGGVLSPDEVTDEAIFGDDAKNGA